jgi:hypothetical protein
MAFGISAKEAVVYAKDFHAEFYLAENELKELGDTFGLVLTDMVTGSSFLQYNFFGLEKSTVIGVPALIVSFPFAIHPSLLCLTPVMILIYIIYMFLVLYYVQCL